MKHKSIIGGLNLKSLFLTLLVATCMAGLYYGFVHLKDIIVKSPSQVRLYYKKVYKFSEQEKAAFAKNHAGLWQFTIETMSGGKTVKKTDRLEIKENGIVWQVTEWNVTMPKGSLESFCQIRTAFLKPYGVVRNDSLCDAFILTQAFIAGPDTCFGGWNYPELWEFHKDGASLVFNKRRYTSWNGELAGFFPPGSVEYVQSAQDQFLRDTVITVNGVRDTIQQINQLYSVRKMDPQTGTIKLVPIRDSITDLYQIFRASINRECANHPGKKANQDEITELVSRYFDPFVINEKLRNFPRELPGAITAFFMVNPDGGVDSVRLTSAGDIDKMLSEDMAKEIGLWRFPSLDMPAKVEYPFRMP